MAVMHFRALTIIWIWCLMLGCWTVTPSHEHLYIRKPLSSFNFKSGFALFGANKPLLNVDIGWTIWFTGISMETMALFTFKQKLLIDPVIPKYSKSRFRYYANTDASYNIELNPGPTSTEVTSQQATTRTYDSTSSRIPTRITQRTNYFNQPYHCLSRYANHSNLITVQRTPYLCPFQRHASKKMHLCLLNARSIRNKAMIVKDFIVDNGIDLLALTETWLRSNNEDSLEIGNVCPNGYRLLHVPRSYGVGGGVGLIFKNSININTSITDTFQSFELMDVRIRSVRVIRMLLVYRPPNKSSWSVFLDEFSRLLECVTAEPDSNLIFLGDFNIHVDNPNDTNARSFIDLLDSFNLQQHVSEATHSSGHTLDLIISNAVDHPIKGIKVSDPVISDHLAVHCSLHLEKPHFEKKIINSRKLRSIDMESLRDDIVKSELLSHHSDLDSLVTSYDSVLLSLLDKHAPLKERVVTIRPAAPWYTDEISQEKRKRRRLERKWRSSKTPDDRTLFVHQCSVVNNLVKTSKLQYYSSIIKESRGNHKQLFRTVDKLLQKQRTTYYPPSPDSRAIADVFADFFQDKIDKLQSGLLAKKGTSSESDGLDSTYSTTKLSSNFSVFAEVELEDIRTVAMTTLSKSCDLDPLPSNVIKPCADILLPIITNIVNSSLQQGYMPAALKSAVLTPLLKKADADHLQFKNFRPISNLKAVSKIIEKCVAIQLNSYLTENDLHEQYQSAYKTHHSTETAMVKVHDDLLCAVDNNMATVLLMLDLSAAFDTVNHNMLLERLTQRYGITGTVLEWMSSYLSSRTQSVKIDNCRSSSRPLLSGVPQGSVLGPIMYILYTNPIADIIKKHKLSYHLYADDSQLYVSFESGRDDFLSSVISSIRSCVQEIITWMIHNGLKLNEDKTELLLLSSRFRKAPTLDSILVGEETIRPSSTVRNLGVVLDPYLSMEAHVKKVTKTCHYHLNNICKLRMYLDKESTETIIHAFVTANLDYCNSILYGLPKVLLNRLQLVQNRAARIVTFTKKYEHITPTLIDLHWLPVKYRIMYKLLLLVYKAINGLAPIYLRNLLSFRRSSRYSLRSGSTNMLNVPKSRLKSYGDRRFSVAGPKLWNTLPEHLRQETSLSLFKKSLKTFLFKQTYS